MRYFIFSAIALVFSSPVFGTKITINTAGFIFNSADVTINLGDTISFNVGSGHTATEVSQDTWIANNPTPVSGAFNFGPGSEQQVLNLSLGVHFYVCQNHVGSMGMKGKITVQAVSGVKTKITDSNLLKIFPNPSKDYIFFEAKELDIKKIVLTSIDGKISKEIIPGKNTNKILINDLPNSVYLFSVYTMTDEVYEKEFVKN